MDEFDRDRQSRESRESRRYGEREPRRRPVDADEPEQRPARTSRDDPQRRQPITRPDDSDAPRRQRPVGNEPLPRSGERPSSEGGERYSDRFRRTHERSREEREEVPVTSRDPYDRLRKLGNRPARRVEPEGYDEDYIDPDEYEEFDQRSVRGRGRPKRDAVRSGSTQVRAVGSLLANPAPENRALVLGGFVATASLVLLIVLILVRYGSAPAWIPIHLNAEGTAIRFGTRAAIWRLPVFALFATAMSLGLGWWLRKREPFAVQFLAVGTLMVHVIVWVGVITLLW